MVGSRHSSAVPAAASSAERLLRYFGAKIAHVFYRVSPHFPERLPAGGFLLLPNHLTWIDAIVLQLACPRPIRFVVFEEIYNHRVLNPIFRAVGALAISPRRAKDAVKQAAELIARGEIVCIFPEGELSRSGILLRLKRGYELIARAAQCPVVPGVAGSTLGLHFLVRRGEVLPQVARAAFPIP